MEASKCPNCGEEPSFLEHMEKWYCYECNSYVDSPEAEVHEEPAEEVEEEVMEESLEVVEETAVETPVEAETPVVEAPEEPVPVKEAVEIRICPNCEQPLKWIEKYQRYYCYSCKKYAPVEKKPEPEAAAEETPVKAPVEPVKADPVKTCPDCSGEMKFIEKYNEWYCHTCKKYPLHKPKEKPAANGKPKSMTCPKCQGPLKYVEKYGRHYCYACKAYAPKNGAAAPEKKYCPGCRSELKYIKQYNEWYCYKCKKYPLRPSKPVLLL